MIMIIIIYLQSTDTTGKQYKYFFSDIIVDYTFMIIQL